MALNMPGKCCRGDLYPQPQHFILSTKASVTPSLACSQGLEASSNKQAADWSVAAWGLWTYPWARQGEFCLLTSCSLSGGSWGPVRNQEGEFLKLSGSLGESWSSWVPPEALYQGLDTGQKGCV